MGAVERFDLLGPPVVSSLAVAGVHAWLRVVSREPYVGVWALAAGLFVLRYLYGLFGTGGIDWAPWGGRGLTHYTIFAGAVVGSGVLLLRSAALPRAGRVLAGSTPFVLGTIQLSFPWSSTLPAGFRRGAFLVSPGAQIFLGIGVLMALFAQAQRETEELAKRLSESLTRALEDFLPIRAHCPAIQDEGGGWERLESYVGRRTGARFSQGICPGCLERHYPEAL